MRTIDKALARVLLPLLVFFFMPGFVVNAEGIGNLTVTLIGQENEFYCGPASYQMHYDSIYGPAGMPSQDTIAANCNASATGIDPDNIAGSDCFGALGAIQRVPTNRQEQIADRDDIVAEIDAGRPVLIYWNPSTEYWMSGGTEIFSGLPHYSVVVGYIDTGVDEEFRFVINDPWPADADPWPSPNPGHVHEAYYHNIDGGMSQWIDSKDNNLAHRLGYYWKITPNPSKDLDLIFVIDTTGSMWDDLYNVKLASTSIVDAIASNPEIGAFRVAIADYHDYPRYPYGGSSDFPYRAVLPFSSDQAAISAALQSLYASGGADWPESVYYALDTAINTQGLTPWRNNVNKAVILMGDAPNHDLIDTAYPLRTTAQDVIQSAYEVDPAIIYSIVIGSDMAAYDDFAVVAEGSGGQVFTASSAGQVVDAILEAIGAIGQGPANHPPDVSGAVASVSELWPVNHKLREVDILNVTDPDGDPITLTITQITQDEPVTGGGSGNTKYDATGLGTDTAWVRAERAGTSNGRVYRITFTASDGRGGESTGVIYVGVPHDQGENSICVDDGQIYISTGN